MRVHSAAPIESAAHKLPTLIVEGGLWAVQQRSLVLVSQQLPGVAEQLDACVFNRSCSAAVQLAVWPDLLDIPSKLEKVAVLAAVELSARLFAHLSDVRIPARNICIAGVHAALGAVLIRRLVCKAREPLALEPVRFSWHPFTVPWLSSRRIPVQAPVKTLILCSRCFI